VGELTIRIGAPSKRGQLQVGELAAYLSLLNQVYQVAGIQAERGTLGSWIARGDRLTQSLVDALQDDRERLGRTIREYTRTEGAMQYPAGGGRLLNRGAERVEALEIVSLSYGSPLTLVLSSAVVILTMAVVVSGGSIEIGPSGVKAELPPVAEGIERLHRLIHGDLDTVSRNQQPDTESSD